MHEQELQDRELLELLDDVKVRIGEDEPFFDTPPDDVWAAIDAELANDDTTVVDHGDDTDTIEVVAPPVEATQLQATQSNVTSLDHHRRKRRPVGILLGAVAAAVAAAIAIPALSSGDAVIAEIALDSLEGASPIGSASVIDEGDGSLRLDIEFNTGLVCDSSCFELWVIDTEVNEMHSLGFVGSTGDGYSASYDLPEGVAIADFPIIDISEEPYDGDPTHSGDSKWRGIVDT